MTVRIETHVRGKSIEAFIAGNADVQNAFGKVVARVERKAKRELKEHFFEGHSFIEVERGSKDAYVVLNDTRGQKAAMSIEYGRQANSSGQGGMEGLFILHHAVNLEVK